MTDLSTLFAKIRALPKRRMAEVDDFVDFLILRRPGQVKPPLSFEERMEAVDRALQARDREPPV